MQKNKLNFEKGVRGKVLIVQSSIGYQKFIENLKWIWK